MKRTTLPTGGRIDWYGDELMEEVRREAKKRILIAANHLKQATRRGLSVRARVPGGSETRYKPKRDIEPSEPGEKPRRDTGQLHKTIFSRTGEDGRGAYFDVGTDQDYGVYHELTDRPFLRPTLKEEERKLKRILAG